jgi:hypothetical protein
MTTEEFDALLARRDDLQRQHRLACEVLEEEPCPGNHRRCSRLYDELATVQKQIDDEIAAERAAKNEGMHQ